MGQAARVPIHLLAAGNYDVERINSWPSLSETRGRSRRDRPTTRRPGGRWATFGLACVGGLWLASCACAAPTTIEATRVIDCGLTTDERPAVVTGVAISADGSTVAAAGDDHVVRIWDAATGELRARLAGHDDWVRTVAISPDGRTLASGSSDHTVCLWNVADGQQLHRVLACDKAITAVSFHPNSQQLAVVGFCNTLEIVNTSTGQSIQEFGCACADNRAVAFSPDGARMAAAGRNGQIRIWNVQNGTLERDIATDTRRIRVLAFSPDGAWLAAAGDGTTIHIYDVATDLQVMSLPARPGRVLAMVFLDKHRLAVGGTMNRIHLWDLDSGVVSCELAGHTGSVAALACTKDGNTLVSGSYDTTVRIWDLSSLPGASSPALASQAAR